MKLVINIDENVFTRLFDNGGVDDVDVATVCAVVRNGISIPNIDPDFYKGSVISQFYCKYDGDCWGGDCEGCHDYVAHYEDIMALIQRIVKEIRPDADIN